MGARKREKNERRKERKFLYSRHIHLSSELVACHFGHCLNYQLYLELHVAKIVPENGVL